MSDADFDDIAGHVTGWLESRYRDKWKNPIEVQDDGTVLQPLERHRVKVHTREVENGQLMEVQWRHPDDRPDANLDWQTEITVAAEDGELEFGTIIRVGSASFAVQPIGRISLGTPRVVKKLMRQYECQSAGVEVATRHTRVTPKEVDMLVNHILYSERALPIVLVSQEYSGETKRPAKTVQDKLLGLAHVYEIEYKAARELTRQLGKSCSCFNGAIRVYWPGFKPSQYLRHPLYLPERVASFSERGDHVENYLFRKFAGIAASRFSEGPISSSVRQKIRKSKLDDLWLLQEEAKDQRAQASKKDEYIDELEMTVLSLEDTVEDLGSKNKQLESRLAVAEENLMAAFQHEIEAPLADEFDSDGEPTPDSFKSVASALAKAGEDFEDRIAVWESAREAAEDSQFARPREVYDAVQAIAELADRYYKGEDRSVGQPWGKFFEEHGLDYKQSESDMTMNLHGESRIFKHEGEQREIQRHITLGGGSRKHCVQIYFDQDDELEKFAIGYCGVHLPYYTQNT
jgi:hypothetical protein